MELSLLVKCGLFTKEEVQSIVRKRRHYEYKLRRVNRSKEDYLAYIEYELKLLKLRNARLDRLRNNSDIAVNPMVKTGGTRHIHFIFERALRKYPSDMRLWGSYIDFCAHNKAERSGSHALGRALQLHPEQTPLWIFAARWELHTNKSLRSARGLFQRAIRTNPTELSVYVEYARLELDALLDITRLKEKQEKRRKELEEAEDEDEDEEMEDHDGDESDDDMNDDEDGDKKKKKKKSVSLESLTLPEAEIDTTDDAEVRNQLQRHIAAAQASTPFLQAAIPIAIYEYAQQQIPHDVRVEIAFLALFSSYKSTTEFTVPPVRKSLRENYSDVPTAWAALAECELRLVKGAAEGNKLATAIFEEGVAAVPKEAAPEMWRLYVAFASSSSEVEPLSNTFDKTAAKRVVELCSRCESASALCERTCDAWITAAAVLNDATLVRQVGTVATTLFPGLARYWQARVAIEKCCSSMSGEDTSKAEARVLSEGIAAMAALDGPEGASHAHELWIEGLRARIHDNETSKKLLAFCEKALNNLSAKQPVIRRTDKDDVALSGGSAGSFAVAAFDMLLEYSKKTESQRSKSSKSLLRSFVDSALKHSAVARCEAFVTRIVDNELDGKAPSKVDIDYVRRIMLATLDKDGSVLGIRCPALWLKYHKMERDAGHMTEAAAVYRRARATLRDATGFVQLVSSSSP